MLPLTLCTPMSSATLVFISASVPLDIVSVPDFLVKTVKEKQDCILEIVSRYMIHLKIRKYNDSGDKTGV